MDADLLKILLEAAAKNCDLPRLDFCKGNILTYDEDGHTTVWQPHSNAYDCLSLALKMDIQIIGIMYLTSPGGGQKMAVVERKHELFKEPVVNDDEIGAVYLAVLRAAAAERKPK